MSVSERAGTLAGGYVKKLVMFARAVGSIENDCHCGTTASSSPPPRARQRKRTPPNYAENKYIRRDRHNVNREGRGRTQINRIIIAMREIDYVAGHRLFRAFFFLNVKATYSESWK